MPRAELDAFDASAFIETHSPAAAKKWMIGLREKIRSLAENPERGSLIPESQGLSYAYRSLLHHSHRINFRVDKDSQTVSIVRIFHGARQPLGQQDLE